MNKRILTTIIALLAVASTGFSQNLLPRARRGASIGISGQGWSNIVCSTIICESGSGTNTLTTPAGLLDATKVSGTLAATVAANSVASTNVVDNTIKGADILDGSIGSADIGYDAVGTNEISPSAVGTSELAPNSITVSKMTSAYLTGTFTNLEWRAGATNKVRYVWNSGVCTNRTVLSW